METAKRHGSWGHERIKPIMSKKLWFMANYSMLGEDDDRLTFGGLETLQLISQGCKDRVDWSFYGLTVLSFLVSCAVGRRSPCVDEDTATMPCVSGEL